MQAIPEEDCCDARKVDSAENINVQHFGIARLSYTFDCQGWVEPISLLEDTSTRYGMIDCAVLIKGFLEEVVDVAVLAHISLDIYDLAGKLFDELRSCLLVNIS